MKILKILFALLAIGVSMYPLAYFVADMSGGLLGSKSDALLNSSLWNAGFYIHICFGGIALFVGWSQFFKSIRNKYLMLHRRLGIIYCVSVLLSGVAGLYIATHASGGIVSVLGFTMLAILWLYTTTKAFLAIRERNIIDHERWMIRSYALCFAAVTLRLWLPAFMNGIGMDFIDAYRIIAWLCWVPNIIVAELIIRRVQA